MNRRQFFRSTIGAAVSAALVPYLPKPVVRIPRREMYGRITITAEMLEASHRGAFVDAVRKERDALIRDTARRWESELWLDGRS